MSNFENMSPEQQQYTQLRAVSKQLYQARKLSMELQDAALSPDSDSLSIAQRANELGRMVETSANQIYATQKTIEKQHPEFKAQVVEYAQTQAQIREYAEANPPKKNQTQEQSY